jgi:transcription antitermination protein NusB
MSRRSDQRRAAVFALYQHDLTGRPLDDVFEHDAAPFTRALAHATADNADELDARIERHTHGWTLDRIAPLEGAIDEAVETAKAFCGPDAPGFVNGILGAALDDVRDNGAHHG